MLLPVGTGTEKAQIQGPLICITRCPTGSIFCVAGIKTEKRGSVSSIKSQQSLRKLIYIPVQPIIVYGIFNQIELECICT